VVVLDDTTAGAEARLARLDELDGTPLRSDAAVLAGSPGEVAEQLVAWAANGLAGFRLRPAVIGHDLDAIVDGLVPALRTAGRFRHTYEPGSLRERFGLERPISRYAEARS